MRLGGAQIHDFGSFGALIDHVLSKITAITSALFNQYCLSDSLLATSLVQRLVNFDGLERSQDFSLMLVSAKSKVFTTYQNLPNSVLGITKVKVRRRRHGQIAQADPCARPKIGAVFGTVCT
jgi:hypothetical protein